MERGYRNATRAFGVVTVVVGIALIASTLSRGGGPLAVGVVIGAAFTLLGAGRVYLAGRSRQQSRP